MGRAFEHMAQGVRVVGVRLHGIEMRGFRQHNAVVLIHQHLAGGGAGGEGYAKLASQQGAKGIRKKRVKQGGVLHIADVAQAYRLLRAKNIAAAQHPTVG